jgi:phosphoglycolate phosphatase
MFEHVVFDLDGTLIDSGADLAAAVNHALRELGLRPLPVETLVGYVGEGARVLVQRALGAARQELVGPALDAFLAYYGAHLLDATRAYPGVPEALGALGGRGVAMSVLTNKPVAMSRAILAGLGIASCFVDVVGGDSLPVRKPDPAGVEHLRARTGTPRDRMLLVGDSPIDLRTARAAEVAFCGVGWGLAADALRAAWPEPLLARPAELVARVESG